MILISSASKITSWIVFLDYITKMLMAVQIMHLLHLKCNTTIFFSESVF